MSGTVKERNICSTSDAQSSGFLLGYIILHFLLRVIKKMPPTPLEKHQNGEISFPLISSKPCSLSSAERCKLFRD
jgi:hypothetical protein